MKLNLKDGKTQLVIGGILLAIGILTYLHFINKPLKIGNKNNEINTTNPTQSNSEDNSGNNSGNNSENSPNANLDVNLVLKRGSQGEEVKELQKILINKYTQNLGKFGDNKDGIDGKFGNMTLTALLKAKKVSKIALKDL